MPNKSGQNLVDDARSRSGYQNTQFVTDTEVLGWINDERRKLRDLMRAEDETLYSQPYGFSLPDPVLAAAYTAASLGVPPPHFAALPLDFDSLQGLDWATAPFSVTGGGPAGQRPTTTHMFNFQQRNDLEGPRYKVFGRIAGVEILMVMPEENSAGSYRAWYTAIPPDLTLTDTLDANEQRFNDFISTGAAIRILSKAKRNTNEQRNDQASAIKRIETMNNNRDSEAEQGGTSGQSRQRWPYYFGR